MSDTALGGGGPTLLMVAHGTRTPAGVQTIHDLAAAVSVRVGPVQTAFVDVLGPHPADILAAVTGQAVVVPTFLASGFHVRCDLPSRIAESGHRDTVLTAALGPDPQLADAMVDRLREVGWQAGDVVVVAAAGSSDPLARAELRSAAALLSRRVGEVHLGYIATGTPTVTDLITRLRATGARRVFIAPYLLAAGLFHARLAAAGADAVAAPLGVHHHVAALVAARFTAGIADSQPVLWTWPGHPLQAPHSSRVPTGSTASRHRQSSGPRSARTPRSPTAAVWPTR